MQKDLTKMKIFPKVFFWGGGLLFIETPCTYTSLNKVLIVLVVNHS